MNLTRTQKRWIAVGIGVVFILFGAVQGLLGIEIQHPIVHNLFLILFFFAAILLLSKEKEKQSSETEDERLEAKDSDSEQKNQTGS